MELIDSINICLFILCMECLLILLCSIVGLEGVKANPKRLKIQLNAIFSKWKIDKVPPLKVAENLPAQGVSTEEEARTKDRGKRKLMSEEISAQDEEKK